MHEKKCWDESHTNKSTCLILDMICVTILLERSAIISKKIEQNFFFFNLLKNCEWTALKPSCLSTFFRLHTVFPSSNLSLKLCAWPMRTRHGFMAVLSSCSRRRAGWKLLMGIAYEEFIARICFCINFSGGNWQQGQSLAIFSMVYTDNPNFLVLANWKTFAKCSEIWHLETFQASKTNSFSCSVSAKCTAELFLLFNLPSVFL